MIRSLFFTRLSRLNFSSVSHRLWNSTTSTLQQNQDDNVNFDLGSGNGIENDLVKQVVKKKTEYGLRKMMAQNFKHFFSCSDVEAVKLVDQNKSLWKIPLAKINANIEFLYEKNITAKSIIENPWMLGAPISKCDFSLLIRKFI